MIIEDRARVLWAESLDKALGGGQFETILTILTEGADQIEPIPTQYLIKSLQSFFPDPPSDTDTLLALTLMGFTTQEKESPMQSES